MADPKPLTAPQAKALAVIHAAGHGGINPSWFGEKMWPETTSSGSNGSWGHIPDTGRNLSAGAFLSRLHKKGWLYRAMPNGVTTMYTLSPAGRASMEATHTGEEVRLAVPADLQHIIDAATETTTWLVIWENEDGTTIEEIVQADDRTDAIMQAGAYEPGLTSVTQATP